MDPRLAYNKVKAFIDSFLLVAGLQKRSVYGRRGKEISFRHGTLLKTRLKIVFDSEGGRYAKKDCQVHN